MAFTNLGVEANPKHSQAVPHPPWTTIRPSHSAFQRSTVRKWLPLSMANGLAALISDPRDPSRVIHPLADILRARILAIACGYEDADDLDHLRRDTGFKLACGRLPASGRDLCSQPTMSRWENAPSLREVIRLTRTMVDLYCASYPKPPAAVTLDIDDTVDVVHGRQQLSLFNAHYDERCFLPIHVYDTATSRPVMVLLRGARYGEGAGRRARQPAPARRHAGDGARGRSSEGRHVTRTRGGRAALCRGRTAGGREDVARARCGTHRARRAGAGRRARLAPDAGEARR
jgi:hypothetical protein